MTDDLTPLDSISSAWRSLTGDHPEMPLPGERVIVVDFYQRQSLAVWDGKAWQLAGGVPREYLSAWAPQESRASYKCPHCDRSEPHQHSKEEIAARDLARRYPDRLCTPFGGSDYCYYCSRDMCNAWGIAQACPSRLPRERHSESRHSKEKT
jgi:hypothetical protein